MDVLSGGEKQRIAVSQIIFLNVWNERSLIYIDSYWQTNLVGLYLDNWMPNRYKQTFYPSHKALNWSWMATENFILILKYQLW